MTLADRWRWIVAAWRAIRAAFTFDREILAAVPPSAKPKGDIMSTITTADLTALVSFLKEGAPVASAIGKAVADPTIDEGFSVAESLASVISLPQAQAAVYALKGLQFIVDEVVPLIKSGKIKPHNTGEGGIGADPAGNGLGV